MKNQNQTIPTYEQRDNISLYLNLSYISYLLQVCCICMCLALVLNIPGVDPGQTQPPYNMDNQHHPQYDYHYEYPDIGKFSI